MAVYIQLTLFRLVRSFIFACLGHWNLMGNRIIKTTQKTKICTTLFVYSFLWSSHKPFSPPIPILTVLIKSFSKAKAMSQNFLHITSRPFIQCAFRYCFLSRTEHFILGYLFFWPCKLKNIHFFLWEYSLDY